MKKIFILYLAVVMFLVAGCPGNQASNIAGPSTGTSSTGSTGGSTSGSSGGTSTTTTTTTSSGYYLKVNSVSLSSSSVSKGGSVTVNYTVDAYLASQSVFGSPVWTVGIYLSTTSSTNTSSTMLTPGDGYYVNGVKSLSSAVTIPSTKTAGNYYIVVFVAGLGSCNSGSCYYSGSAPITVN